ncbi:unnamed protein product, partial [Urochloa humidicola]
IHAHASPTPPPPQTVVLSPSPSARCPLRPLPATPAVRPALDAPAHGQEAQLSKTMPRSGGAGDSKYIPSIVADLQPPETTPDSPENHMNDEEEGMGSDPDVMNEEGEL